MLPDDTRRKIKNITDGVILEGQSDNCTTIRNYLCQRFETSREVKKNFEGNSIIKKEQARILIEHSTENHHWFKGLPETYLTRGGEAKVYLEGKNVLKVNDAVYYATWLEYLNSILIHNLVFPNTSYDLVGFIKEANTFSAVVRQPFIVTDSQVEIADIKKFLEFNGFQNIRRNDYLHTSLGLILEDMHDENVLVRDENLFFIDTVFYITSAGAALY